MKRIFTLLSLALISVGTNAQTVPNGDFEDVQEITITNPAPMNISYDSLGGGWVSGNEVNRDIALGTIPPFMKDTNWAQSGNHAILMRTQEIFGIIATGNAGLGTYEYDAANPFNSVKVGIAYTERPDSLVGYYDYLSVSGDSCKVGVFFSKWNANTMERDTIGLGEFTTDQSTGGNYTRFSVPISYSTMDTPDTMGIIALSSKGGFGGGAPVGQIGSTLVLDNINFAINDASIFENSLSNVKFISNENNLNAIAELECTIFIYSATGSLILKKELTQGINTFPIESSNSIYFIKVIGNNIESSIKLIH